MTPTDHWPPSNPTAPLAVLVSGGLDSAVLLAEAARAYPDVVPIYVRVGMLWEAAERAHLDRFLDATRTPAVRPLVVLDQPAADLYGGHWSVTGAGAPAATAPHDADFLPGRNVLLFAKPLLWCHLHGVPELATAPLGTNPFPDATPAFYDGLAAVVARGMGAPPVRILRPYARLHKPDVLRRGLGFPLRHTFSCVRPVGLVPCGTCIKCGERQAGFREAGVVDPTEYAGCGVRGAGCGMEQKGSPGGKPCSG
ncbi:MAG TPA: 7-cyano-7-deazaguanine synthase [Urbifossiella sp.]|nr:7-cyano-7-deazaguanine synthase [Urbifossiella sp.]